MQQIALAASICRQFEGVRLTAYLCPAGVPTLGIGSTGPDIKLGMTCTVEWAEQRLLKDLAGFWRGVAAASPILLTQPAQRQAAVLDWTYNLGLGRYKSSTFRRMVNAGRWTDAANEIRKWVYGGGKKLKGLVLRRDVEARFLLLATMIESGASP